METLGDALPKEMARIRDEVMPAYQSIGPAGQFALAFMRRDLDLAAKAVAWEGRFWLELREPNCIPERKGPFPTARFCETLREFFEARPKAFISVVTIDNDGPHFEDATQALEMADGRSSPTAKKHRASSKVAHGAPPSPDAVREAVMAERNACARDLENKADEWESNGAIAAVMVARNLAAAIRARK